ncbi:MAG: methionine--tRNA ligase subunit beta, partial [Bacteroidales bacterium]|nr:methionine--tRNA ligase subunit beta [Bacteroidales bacterium]
NQAELLFTKVEDSQIDFQMEKLEASRQANAAKQAEAEAKEGKKPIAGKPECTFEEFEKMDIRTAVVLEAERVPNTDKLLHLKLDTGLDKREIVSGIAQYYTPEEMVGKKITILANLQPRKIRGIVSQGMILMAKEPDGFMRIVAPDGEIMNGATVG